MIGNRLKRIRAREIAAFIERNAPRKECEKWDAFTGERIQKTIG